MNYNKTLHLCTFILLLSCRTLSTIPVSSFNYPTPGPSPSPSPSPLSGNHKVPTYTLIDSPDSFLNSVSFKNITKVNSHNVTIKKEAPQSCTLKERIKVRLKSQLRSDGEELLKLKAADIKADTVHLLENNYKDGERKISAVFYFCNKNDFILPSTVDFYEAKDHTDFVLSYGNYINRSGVLKELGDVGPTLGVSFSTYDKDTVFNNGRTQLGWFLQFSFDHFYDTNSELLQPKFTNENFTNYMWSLGLSLKHKLNENVNFTYDIGPAANFLEMDTSRSNSQLEDYEATRTALSMTHNFGVYYKLSSNIKDKEHNFLKESYIGLSILHYWMFDPLGEWARNNTSLDTQNGGSSALMLNYKWTSF